jgi:CRISPR-associated protein Cas2
MRRCCLVCYDIRNPKRLNRVRRLMKGYGTPWQYSVYFCVLTAAGKIKMLSRLEKEMNLTEDRVIAVDLGKNEDAARQCVREIGERVPVPPKHSVAIF